MEASTKKTFLIIIIALVATGGIIFLINVLKKSPPPGGPKKDKGGSVATIRIAKAEIATLKDYIIVNGEVECQTQVDIFPSINGKVYSVASNLGDFVKKGQILMRIDPSEPGSNFALSPVDSPISGVVLSTPLKTGTKVTTSTVVTTIGDTSRLQITAPVGEKYIEGLVPGLVAQVFLAGYPDAVFSSHVAKVSPVVDKDTRTKDTILFFDNYDARINAGMYATIKLYTKDYVGVPVVPKDSVVSNAPDDSYVFVIDGGKATKRAVVVGKTVDNLIQITQGVQEGEDVATEGILSLSDGSQVKVLTSSADQSI